MAAIFLAKFLKYLATSYLPCLQHKTGNNYTNFDPFISPLPWKHKSKVVDFVIVCLFV